MLLNIGHEVGHLRGGKRYGATAPTPDAARRYFCERIFRDPIPLQRQLEEVRDDAAPVVVGLETRLAGLKISSEASTGQVRDRRPWEMPYQAPEVALHARQMRLGEKVLFVFVLFSRNVLCDRFRK